MAEMKKEYNKATFIKQFYYCLTKSYMYPGALNTLHEIPMPGKKALIVMLNDGVFKANGVYDRLTDQLDQAGVEYVLYDKPQPNPKIEDIDEGAVFGVENGCDFIVALGGGGAIDSAKQIGIVMANGGGIWDYVAVGSGGRKPIEKDSPPIIAVVTTSGTGSEVCFGAVVTNEETGEKLSVRHDSIGPKIAIIDPELMVTCPPRFTAFQGFDAFLQCAEGCISNYMSLASEMVAYKGVEEISKWLPVAVNEPDNVEARHHMAFGAWLGGYDMMYGSLTSGHAMEHALSGYHNTLPHGAGLIMDCVAHFSFFVEHHACDEKFIKMAKAMGKEDADDPWDFIDCLKKLIKDCHVDDLKMSDYGITPDEFPQMAEDSMTALNWLFTADPIQLTKEDVISIYEKSYR